MQTSTRENWLITVIVVLGFMLVFNWMGGDNKKDASVDGTSTTTISTTEEGTITVGDSTDDVSVQIVSGDNAGTVVISDQVAGKEVVIDRVNLEKAGWVMIRQDKGGVPSGFVLGARCFSAGTNQGNMTVWFGKDKKPFPAGSYFAELHSDNDGKCVYDDADVNSIIVDAKGEPVQASFKTFTASTEAVTATSTSTNTSTN